MSLAPDGPEIAAIRRGLAVMRARPLSDPTSWDFQVNIHATRDLSNPAVWNQCQHGNYFFLPWHRMYIYWFERILRDASGDPDLGAALLELHQPRRPALPEVYRFPADASNPLFVAERNTDAGGVNHGARLPASAAATAWLPFRLVNFSTALPSGAAFGGRVVDRPVHLMPTMGSFESYHNVMHVLIGGENGYMSDPTAASRDPVFFAHHANVDRLWNRWLDQGGGRANPLDDRTWMDTRFKFFDEKRRPREMAVRDALDDEELGYRYDDDPTPLARPRPGRAAPAAPLLPMAASEGPPDVLGTDGPTRVTIGLGDKARAAAGRRHAGHPRRGHPVREGADGLLRGLHQPARGRAGRFPGRPLRRQPGLRRPAAVIGIRARGAHGTGHHRAGVNEDLDALRAIEITDVVREPAPASSGTTTGSPSPSS